MLPARKGKLIRRHQSDGFTLIEVLVTFVILAVGLLGIVSLQALSKTSQHQAIQRTRAVSIADDILERIRINPAGLVAYTGGASTSAPVGGGTISPEPADCVAAPCTTAEMAARDLWAWEQLLDGEAVTVEEGGVTTATAGLNGAKGCIVFIAAPGKSRTGLLTVLVQWSDMRDTGDAVQAGEATCGGASAGTDKYRRQVVATTFIIDEVEL